MTIKSLIHICDCLSKITFLQLLSLSYLIFSTKILIFWKKIVSPFNILITRWRQLWLKPARPFDLKASSLLRLSQIESNLSHLSLKFLESSWKCIAEKMIPYERRRKQIGELWLLRFKNVNYLWIFMRPILNNVRIIIPF